MSADAQPLGTEIATATANANARRPRLGFLGVGWIGRHRLDALRRSGAAEVAAIADPSAECRAQVGAGSFRRCASLDELLAGAAELDGVVIATPSALHAAQASAVLQRGLAVFCQKPLARNAAEARQVVDAARRADRLLGVDLSYRGARAMQRVRELVAGGELGTVHACELTFHNAYGPDKPWFYDARLSGGGCLIDLGLHLVDLALWTLGEPRVTAVTAHMFAGGRPMRDAGPPQVEDLAIATLELETGAVVRLACSWRLPAGRDAIIEAAFWGTRGGARVGNVAGSFFDFRAELCRGTTCETLVQPPDDWGGRAAIAWADALGRGSRFDADVESAVRVAEVLDRLYAAAGVRREP